MQQRSLRHSTAELTFALALQGVALVACERTGEAPPPAPTTPSIAQALDASADDGSAEEGPDPLAVELQRSKRARANPMGPDAQVAGQWRSCDVFNGRVTFCGGWHTGKVVLDRAGIYQECDVFNGRLSFCGGVWYTGHAVVEQGGVHKECDVNAGHLGICRTWFTGKTPLLRKE